MKILDTTKTGGFPFVLDDLRWMQQGIMESFKALANLTTPLGSPLVDTAILVGIQDIFIFGNYANIRSEGFLYHNGEVLYCEGSPQVSEQSGYDWYFYIEDTAEMSLPSGIKSFKDGSGPYSVYLNRVAKLSYTDTPSLEMVLLPPRESDIYTSLYKSIRSTPTAEKIHEKIIGSGDTWPGTYQLFAQRDVSERVHLTGTMWYEDLSMNTVMFTILTKYRPLTTLTVALPDTKSARMLIAEIQPNGQVISRNVVGGENYNYIFSFDTVLFL